MKHEDIFQNIKVRFCLMKLFWFGLSSLTIEVVLVEATINGIRGEIVMTASLSSNN